MNTQSIMAVFTYKASEATSDLTSDSEVDGIIVADTLRQARDLLREKGLWVHRIEQQRLTRAIGEGWRGWRAIAPARRRASRGRVISFVRELSTLLGVGLP